MKALAAKAIPERRTQMKKGRPSLEELAPEKQHLDRFADVGKTIQIAESGCCCVGLGSNPRNHPKHGGSRSRA